MQAEMIELAKYRLNKAEECLSDSRDAYEEDRLANSIYMLCNGDDTCAFEKR